MVGAVTCPQIDPPLGLVRCLFRQIPAYGEGGRSLLLGDFDAPQP